MIIVKMNFFGKIVVGFSQMNSKIVAHISLQTDVADKVV